MGLPSYQSFDLVLVKKACERLLHAQQSKSSGGGGSLEGLKGQRAVVEEAWTSWSCSDMTQLVTEFTVPPSHFTFPNVISILHKIGIIPAT